VPSLADSFLVVSSAADLSTLTSSSFTVTAGDVLVVKGVIEGTLTSAAFGTPTDTNSNTWALRASDSSSSRCWVGLWTAVAANTVSMTVSMTPTGHVFWHSMMVEHWASSALAGSPAISSPITGSGSPSASLTTTAAASAVSWLNGDWNANDPTGRVYNSTSASPVDEGVHDKSTGNYVAYYAYQSAASAGSQTIGLTAPTGQVWSMIGVEVLDVPGGGAGGVDQNQFGTILWQ
jgi:hypothetical protein